VSVMAEQLAHLYGLECGGKRLQQWNGFIAGHGSMQGTGCTMQDLWVNPKSEARNPQKKGSGMRVQGVGKNVCINHRSHIPHLS